MKQELKQTLIVAKLALLMLWPVSAWAATIAFGAQLAQIPLLSMLMTVILSTLMGATSLLHAMKQEYETQGAIQRLGFFVAYRMLSSNAAGLLMFFAGESWQMDNNYKAAAIMLSAFGGTWSIERALTFFANKTVPDTPK